MKIRSLARPTALVLTLGLLAGCGGDDSTKGTKKTVERDPDVSEDVPPEEVGSPSIPFAPLTVEPPDVHDVAGKYGGQLTWAELGEVSTFNPITAEGATENELSALVFDGLIAYDNGAWEMKPSLAWKWETSPDNLVWTFHLRKGVRWNDGQPFTAKDVVFTFESLIFNDKIPSSTKEGFKVGDADYPDFEAVDDYTVRATLPVVNALFLTYASGVKIMAEHVFRDAHQGDEPKFLSAMATGGDLTDVVGTGPFKVIEYSGAEGVLYERNPYSWRVDKNGNRLPYLDRVLARLFADTSTRTTSFLSGDFDTITDIPAADYQRVKEAEKSGAFTIHRLGLSLNTNWIVFNQNTRLKDDGTPVVAAHTGVLLRDPKFRRAMSHAIDRENLVKLMLDGKGEAIYGPTSPGNTQWFDDSFEKTPYDVDRAKALLAEIGLADQDGDGVLEDKDGKRVSIELTTNVENQTRVKVINQIKADWIAVGVEATVKPVNFQELVHQLQDGHEFESLLLGWGSSVPPDPLFGVNIHRTTGRLHAWNPMQETPANEWEAKGDAILDEMQNEPDAAKRKPLWAKYLKHHAEGLPILYLYTQNAYAASNKNVRGLRPSVLRPQTWHNIEELWLDD